MTDAPTFIEMRRAELIAARKALRDRRVAAIARGEYFAACLAFSSTRIVAVIAPAGMTDLTTDEADSIATLRYAAPSVNVDGAYCAGGDAAEILATGLQHFEGDAAHAIAEIKRLYADKAALTIIDAT